MTPAAGFIKPLPGAGAWTCWLQVKAWPEKREGTFLRLNTNLPCSIHCISDRFIVDIIIVDNKGILPLHNWSSSKPLRIEFTLIASGENTLGKGKTFQKFIALLLIRTAV